MSNLLSDDSGKARLRLSPVETQIAFALLAAVTGMVLLQFDRLGLSPLLMLTVLFVGGMWAKRNWAIWLLLGVIIYLKYFAGHINLQFGVQLRGQDVAVAMLIIVLAAACFRYLESARFLEAFYPNTKLREPPRHGIKFEFPSLLGGRWWVIPLAVIVSVYLLHLTFNGEVLRQFRFRPTASRVVFLILLLFFGWFVCRAGVGMIIRWRMKPEQADVQCRSFVAGELWKESFNIERYRVKDRKKEN